MLFLQAYHTSCAEYRHPETRWISAPFWWWLITGIIFVTVRKEFEQENKAITRIGCVTCGEGKDSMGGVGWVVVVFLPSSRRCRREYKWGPSRLPCGSRGICRACAVLRCCLSAFPCAQMHYRSWKQIIPFPSPPSYFFPLLFHVPPNQLGFRAAFYISLFLSLSLSLSYSLPFPFFLISSDPRSLPFTKYSSSVSFPQWVFLFSTVQNFLPTL